MLPDFHRLKSQLHDLLVLGMRFTRFHDAPMIALAPKHIIHEGNKTILLREETEECKVPLKKSSAEFKFDPNDVVSLKLKNVFDKFQEGARKVAIEQEKHFIEEINKAVEEIGNVVHGEGEPLSPEKFLEIIEKIHFDFNSDGTPRFPTFFAGQEVIDRLKIVLDMLEKEPYKTKSEIIMNKKRSEYNARESNRKLVD